MHALPFQLRSWGEVRSFFEKKSKKSKFMHYWRYSVKAAILEVVGCLFNFLCTCGRAQNDEISYIVINTLKTDLVLLLAC